MYHKYRGRRRTQVKSPENTLTKPPQKLSQSKESDVYQGIRNIEDTKRIGPETKFPITHNNQMLSVQNKESYEKLQAKKAKSHRPIRITPVLTLKAKTEAESPGQMFCKL